MSVNRKMLKLVAIGYVIKTAAVGVAWLLIPDLPERAAAGARQAWVWAAGSAAAAPPAATPASTAR